ncbi:YlzJ-like family protein [Desulforamulus hydrothermalis]|uniref:YlzJ-like protein n=1 Tax=Desulforamulus hydrothermalis Lam5 = DSM 18033 TaxID=1121428 RepID=K8E128_9FIRM|nr:YlzJ-like family protein [Desulforamulus hydrothermalis]CCO09402.1 conserved hypothetical protein [Desulforamulus hydrothermalis Lam5 = DSM 18033]SHH08891.1 YlzJ-like protein [Desulforamulus hydrothermalis Lam5 = DSM 18033]
MILWTPLPAEQVLAGLDRQEYPSYESISVAGIPVLAERTADCKKRVVRINSSDLSHYLNQDVYPGLII